MWTPILGGILTDDWIKWVGTTYSLLILAIPVVLTAIVKFIAIIHPSVPSDKICDLIKEVFVRKPK